MPAHLAADLRKIKLAEAIRYAVSCCAIFERFLTDGPIELDANIGERVIRPQTITRERIASLPLAPPQLQANLAAKFDHLAERPSHFQLACPQSAS